MDNALKAFYIISGVDEYGNRVKEIIEEGTLGKINFVRLFSWKNHNQVLPPQNHPKWYSENSFLKRKRNNQLIG